MYCRQMKKCKMCAHRFGSILILIVLLCFSPVFLAAREGNIIGDTFEEIAGTGLVIRTSPANVRVLIDGVERGLTPLTLDNLRLGEHRVTLIREGFKERTFNVTLFGNSRLVVSIEMEELRGFALVSVYKADGSPENLPFNPQIFANVSEDRTSAVLLSYDNKALVSLRSGYNVIRARAFGWEDIAMAVTINEHITTPVDFFMRPAVFKIGNASQSRRRFNPMNSSNLGTNEYRFEVSAPGTGHIIIIDKNGRQVHSEQLDPFEIWNQIIPWNGRDSHGNILPEGIYTVTIEVFSMQGIKETIQLETEIDYSINIFPLSLIGGFPGLVFAPMPDVLPAGSYQLEASVNYGYINSHNSFPFVIGFRITPVKNLETAAFFNINPRIDGSGWGVSGSVKYNFFSGGSFPFSMAAGITYAWADEDGENPFSPGRGVGLYIPLSMEFFNSSLAAIFTPGIFWYGPEGIVPSMLVSAGVLYKTLWLNAGLSMRLETDFTESPKFLTGIECRFYPPPSNLVFSAQAGFWTKGSGFGGYGGIGIGIIY